MEAADFCPQRVMDWGLGNCSGQKSANSMSLGYTLRTKVRNFHMGYFRALGVKLKR